MRNQKKTSKLFTAETLAYINRATPKSKVIVVETPTKRYKTVKGSFVKEELNKIFGHDYSFQILDTKRDAHGVLVHGRLTVITESGQPIIREQFGYFHANKSEGDSYKAAATDALKKCAFELGLFRDVASYHVDLTPPTEEEIKISEQAQRGIGLLERCLTLEQVDNVYNDIVATYEECEIDLDKEITVFYKKYRKSLE